MVAPSELVAELRRLEEELWRPETRFDPVRMDRLLSDDFLEFGRSSRVYDRDAVLSAPAQGIPARLPLPNFAVRLVTPDVALVTYETDVACSSGRERARRSSLWTKSPDGWRLRFHQGTPIPDRQP